MMLFYATKFSYSAIENESYLIKWSNYSVFVTADMCKENNVGGNINWFNLEGGQFSNNY